MIDTALSGLQRIFSREFLLAAFLPILLFTGVSGWLASVVDNRGRALWHAVEKMPAITQGLLFVGAIAIVAAIAYLVAALQFSVVRLSEGYWPRYRPFVWLRRRLVERQHTRRNRLAIAEQRARAEGRTAERNSLQLLLAQQYPPPTQLELMMPTRLGNIHRAIEIYPMERYGIDSAVIWPRLRPLLPEAVAAALGESRTGIDALLLLRLLGVVFGTVWPVIFLITGPRWMVVLLALLGWGVAALAYRSALASTIAYGEMVRVAFDLYRHLLLKILDLPVPATLADEQLLWDDLAQFYFRNFPAPSLNPDPASKIT